MGKWSRRDVLKMAGMGGAAALAKPAWLWAAEKSRKPNIIFILSDDYGIDGVSCYGGDKFKTPNIDRLASQGVRFEICHSAPLCGPTRCEFNTGRYAFRTGGLTNGSWGGPAQTAGRGGPTSRDEVGIAKTLKTAGYATCSAGKWRQIGETPGDWGFDEWITDPSAGGWYWQTTCTKNGQPFDLPKDAYYEDVLFDFAMDFVKRHREGPFFL